MEKPRIKVITNQYCTTFRTNTVKHGWDYVVLNNKDIETNGLMATFEAKLKRVEEMGLEHTAAMLHRMADHVNA